MDDLPLSDRLLNEFAMGDVFELIRRINKNLNVPAAQVLIEVDQYPLEAVKIALIGILN
jgi:hypothetical protein